MAQNNQQLADKIMQNQNGGAVEAQSKGHPASQLMRRYEASLVHLLPKDMSFKRFEALVVATARDQPQLMECFSTQVGVSSMLSACLKMASLGFEPGAHMSQCWILPFRDKGVMCAQLIVGWQGHKDLIYRSGLVSYIDGRTVYEKDEFDYGYGTGGNQFLVHKPFRDGDPGAGVAWYVRVVLRDGKEFFHVLHPWQVENKHRAYSKSKSRGPWVDFFDEMALKSTFLEFRKMLPRSVQEVVREAATSDEQIGAPQLPVSTPVDAEFTSLTIDAEAAQEEAPLPQESPPEKEPESGPGEGFDLAIAVWDAALTGKGKQAEDIRMTILSAALGVSFDEGSHVSPAHLAASFSAEQLATAYDIVTTLAQRIAAGIPHDVDTASKRNTWIRSEVVNILDGK